RIARAAHSGHPAAEPGDDPELASRLVWVAGLCARLAGLSGRARIRKLTRPLRELLAWPSAPAPRPKDAPPIAALGRDEAMDATVRRVGAELAKTVFAPVTEPAVIRTLGVFALLFPVGTKASLSGREIELCLGATDLARTQLGGKGIDLAQAIGLLRLE